MTRAACTDHALEARYVSTFVQEQDGRHFASAARLSPVDCCNLEHARILECAHHLLARHERFDIEQMLGELERSGAKHVIPRLHELWLTEIDRSSLDSMGQRLRRLAEARRRREALLLAVQALEDGRDDAFAEHMSSIGVGELQPEHVRLESLADSAAAAVADLVNAPDRAKWRFGFPILDEAIGGAPPGTLTVVGGRTGAGKSSMALAIAIHQARNGLRPGVVSVEDANTVWGPRGLAHVCAVNSESFYTGRFGRDFGDELELGDRELRRSGIEMGYALNRPLGDVLIAIRSLVVGKRCNVITVDYVQAIRQQGERMDRKEFVAHAAKVIKGECQALNVPCLLLSQLARPERGKPFAEPHMTDLKETGDLENISEIIALLWKTSDAGDAKTLGKVAKVKWSPRRPRFEMHRSATGAVNTMTQVTADSGGDESLPDDDNYAWGRGRR